MVVALVSAFIALLLASLLYGIMNSENTTAAPGRMTAEEMMLAVILGFAALTVLYGVVVMVDSRQLTEAAKGVRFLVGVPVPALATLQVALAGGDSYLAELVYAGRSGQPLCSLTAYDTFSIRGVYVPSAIVLVLAVTIWLLRDHLTTPRVSKLRNAVPYLSLGIAVAVAILYSTIPPFDNGFRLPTWGLHILVWSTAVFATFISFLTVAKPQTPAGPLLADEGPKGEPDAGSAARLAGTPAVSAPPPPADWHGPC